MEIKVKVFANSSRDRIVAEKESVNIWVKAKTKNFEANKAVIKLLSKHFEIQKDNIKIIKGKTSRNKIVEIL